MGSDQRFDYTCLGDGVNLASRLEGQSKNYGVRIVLGQRTAELVKDSYPVIQLDCIAVKGKTEGVYIYTLGTTDVEQHEKYLKLYYAGEWTRARAIAKKLMESGNTTIAEYYEKMIERFDDADNHPKTWDGVYRATSK
jgi:adenylate cyclase